MVAVARRSAVVGLVAAGSLLAAGCSPGVIGSSRHGASSAPTVHPSAPATTTTPAAVPAASLAACTDDQLAVTMATTGAASNQEGAVIAFRNAGTAACRLTGYPSVTGDAADGTTTRAVDRTSGYLGGDLAPGGPPVVPLAPGQSASAVVQAVANGCSASDTALTVAPPGTTGSVRLDGYLAYAAHDIPACGLTVSPVVPGVEWSYPAG